MAEMPPTTEEWRKLYDTAIAFRDATPWEWMWDADVFGVQDPASGRIGYCCVMGRLGEHFALGLYQGSEGLAGLWWLRTARAAEREDPGEILSRQICLMASFEDRSELRKQDLEIIKTLGLKFRGRNQWPQFRSYRPGYEPWFLTAAEARFLTVGLQQALEVAERFRNDPKLLPEAKPQGEYLVRLPAARGGEWVWQDTLQRPAPVPRAPGLEPPPLDEARLRRLRETLPATRAVLEIDYFITPATIKGEGDERPWYPFVILAADAASGYILTTELARRDELPTVLVAQLMSAIARMGRRPGRIEVQREETLTLLNPVAERLGIRLVRARRLPAVARARRELGAFLAR